MVDGMGGPGRDVRTSATHPIQVNWLPEHLLPGVGLTFAPGKKHRSLEGFDWDRDLDTDLAVLAREHRADVLVTLMETAELAAMGITDLLVRARSHNLAAIHFPIVDVSAPTEVAPVDDLLAQLEAYLAARRRVVIHCLGGIGRTGTIAACLLVRRGLSADEATRVVRAVRCTRFPEGSAQGPFLRRYEASRLAAHPQSSPRITDAASPERTAPSPPLPWSVLAGPRASPTPPPGAIPVRQVATLLAAVEAEVDASPARAFSTGADGHITLSAAGTTYAAGRFETPTLGELASRVRALPPPPSGRIRLSIVRGNRDSTDIGALQASAPAESMFQAASQFNCLEAPSSRIVPIAQYPFDPTQGPRASVSAFAGTFVRHYFAPRPDGTRFVQTDGDCIDLLAGALPTTAGRVESGYLTADALLDPRAAAAALESHFEHIRIGLHAGVEVSLGANWGGPVPSGPAPRIAQVFTSTIALGSYSSRCRSPALAVVMQQLLRAAYLGTLLGAAALQQRSVVLTLIGGGVFSNPHRAIWDAIHWAITEASRIGVRDLDVLVNARTDDVAEADLEHARISGGTYLELFDGP